jgi:hypothetical protein
MEALDVDPGDRGRLFKGKTLLTGCGRLLLELGCIVVNDGYLHVLGLSLIHVNQGSRRKPARL